MALHKLSNAFGDPNALGIMRGLAGLPPRCLQGCLRGWRLYSGRRPQVQAGAGKGQISTDFSHSPRRRDQWPHRPAGQPAWGRAIRARRSWGG